MYQFIDVETPLLCKYNPQSSCFTIAYKPSIALGGARQVSESILFKNAVITECLLNLLCADEVM